MYQMYNHLWQKKMIIKYLDEELGELILKHIKKVRHILLYQTNTFIMYKDKYGNTNEIP